MSHARKILKYEMQNLLRSKWLIGTAAILFAVTEVLFRFGGDPARTIASLVNIVLVVVPLMSVVLGTIYFYNSREFNELLLAQPVNRTSIYIGKLIGFAGALCVAFLAGLGGPFLIHSYGLREHVTELSKRKESTVALLAGRPVRFVSYNLEAGDPIVEWLHFINNNGPEGPGGGISRIDTFDSTIIDSMDVDPQAFEETDLLFIDTYQNAPHPLGLLGGDKQSP